MERLMKRNKHGIAYYPKCFEKPCEGMGCQIEDCYFEQVICEKLAAYEDYAGWIDAAVEIPPDENEVLVCTITKKGVRGIDKGFYFDGRFIHRGTAEVTHWMPLPPFPED